MQHFISVCALSLAWVTSENYTSTGMPTSFDSIFFAGGWTLSSLLLSPESGVDCPCPRFHADSLLSSRQLSLSSFCPANSHSRPLTTSGHGEISDPRILRNRLLWRATHIVLQAKLSKIVIKIGILTSILIRLLVKSESYERVCKFS